MKFEGPTPETETRQVSVSFAAFIVVVAFVLFGIAMAMGTITSPRTPDVPQPETTAPEESLESQPAPLPAVTEPDPSAVTEPEPDAPDEGDVANAPEAEQPAPPPAQPVATAQAPRSPAGETAAAGAPPVDTHDASFPTHRAAKPAAAPAPATTPPPARNY